MSTALSSLWWSSGRERMVVQKATAEGWLLDAVANTDCSLCWNRGGIRREIDSGLRFAFSITPGTTVHLVLD